ncbi:hypothetical protein C0J29_06730 [Mycobacterium paragordonae]|nr:hypothetical protein [Mycobacterium paragordonae]AYE94522.1 hypothetical protein C0J29_06730 [Mycobacterium paragordonae]
MAPMNRRAALTVFGALATGGAIGARFVIRSIAGSPVTRVRLTNGPGGMGISAAEMQVYREMFARHTEITRTVEEVPGGVRTTTESTSPDLTAQLQAHVSGMYGRLGQGAEVMCMSPTLPSLFRNAGGYRRQLTFTPTGVIAEETADDPGLVETIRAHAREVSGFVRDGMPAMMQGMMGGSMMGPGGMMGPHHRS